ncbi:alanine racemase [Nakamurella silvestris]|nr:alanine racemase [Nakamurella silvestris]
MPTTALLAGATCLRETPAGPYVQVDLDAVASNVRQLRALSSGDLFAVVKSDGFGHGAVAVARTALANGATGLGVTSVTEAYELREAGILAPILSWLNPAETDFTPAVLAGIDIAVPSLDHLHAVTTAARATGRAARVHLHLDVGMSRDGAPFQEWHRLFLTTRGAVRDGLVEMVGMMGHLGCADRPGDPCTAPEIRRFTSGILAARVAGLRPAVCHLAATAATLVEPSAAFGGSRCGAGLVGIDPTRSGSLKPAMTLAAPVVALRQVKAGTPVGYGHEHTTSRGTTLALLPLGYADGIPRAAATRAEVLLRGRRFPLIGQVSMDQIVVDVGDTPVHLGDTATVFGPGTDGAPTMADWADWSGTIEHDIVSGIGRRVRRLYLSSPSPQEAASA